MNTNTFWQYVLDNPDKQWEYDCLSSNPNITWEIVQANPDKDWEYSAVSTNSNITNISYIFITI